MREQVHPALNDITLHDAHRVRVYNRAMGIHFLFSAHGDMGARSAEFTCHLYDSSSLQFSAYIEPGTQGPDSRSGQSVLCCASAKTLDELVYVLDWAHKPSELALLRALLSTRGLTNVKEPVGDLVLRTASPDERAQRQAYREAQAREAVLAQADRYRERLDTALQEACDTAFTLARFGIKVTVTPKLEGLIQRA